MIKSMIAKYPGTCSKSGKRFNRGTCINYDTVTRKASIAEGAEGVEVIPAPAKSSNYGNYVRLSSGAEMYRNSNGRCEDAPCCGCCNY